MSLAVDVWSLPGRWHLSQALPTRCPTHPVRALLPGLQLTGSWEVGLGRPSPWSWTRRRQQVQPRSLHGPEQEGASAGSSVKGPMVSRLGFAGRTVTRAAAQLQCHRRSHRQTQINARDSGVR